jgi:hypothetical protein
MADVSIIEAIALFDHSETARGVRRPAGRWPLRVVDRLRDLHTIDAVLFTPPVTRPKTGIVKGEWDPESKEGPVVRLNPAYFKDVPEKERLPAVSLVLVHEGLHAVWTGRDSLYDEMAARKLSVRYFRELSGPGVMNVLTDRRVRVGGSKFFDEYRQMGQDLDRDQLVDFVLNIGVYTDDRYLDRDWVVNNLDNWGGVRNRRQQTKQLYVTKLLTAADNPHYAARVLAVLESIETNSDWLRMLLHIETVSGDGTLRKLRLAFRNLLRDRGHAVRIDQLERRWKAVLTDRPGGR